MATTDSAERVQIGTGPKQLTPAVDVKGWTRFLRWIFLTDCGRRPCPGVPQLVAVPQPLTDDQRQSARRAYAVARTGPPFSTLPHRVSEEIR
jgi:hypothetical protein